MEEKKRGRINRRIRESGLVQVKIENNMRNVDVHEKQETAYYFMEAGRF